MLDEWRLGQEMLYLELTDKILVFNFNLSIPLKAHQPLSFTGSSESCLRSLLKGQSCSKNKIHCIPEEQQISLISLVPSLTLGWAESLWHGDPAFLSVEPIMNRQKAEFKWRKVNIFMRHGLMQFNFACPALSKSLPFLGKAIILFWSRWKVTVGKLLGSLRQRQIWVKCLSSYHHSLIMWP